MFDYLLGFHGQASVIAFIACDVSLVFTMVSNNLLKSNRDYLAPRCPRMA